MYLLRQLVFFVALGLVPFTMMAQNKYALLIGINDYYEVKGIKSKESLNGSVNDANSIKDLLISRFGFKNSHIDTIYNSAATRDNIMEGLKRKLNQCQPGDIMIFYYSGHGVWMQNSEEEKDPVKRGMNQAMLTSDLYNYSDKFKCFLRDFTLKKYFNLFIDKKVMLTSIFDCCFSGNLAMAERDLAAPSVKTKSIDFNELMARLTVNTENPQLLIDSISGISTSAATGCAADSTGAIKDTLDSDGDGIPDCKDKEKLTNKECFPVDEDGIGKCAFDYLLQNTLNKYDVAELDKNNTNTPVNGVTAERAFNAKEVIKIAEKDTIARPADRKNSRFLFISATTDYQKALEFKDQNNNVHGLFTASILRVFNNNPADISMDDFFKKVKADMGSYHKDQSPVLYSDPARRTNNLIGTKLSLWQRMISKKTKLI